MFAGTFAYYVRRVLTVFGVTFQKGLLVYVRGWILLKSFSFLVKRSAYDLTAHIFSPVKKN